MKKYLFTLIISLYLIGLFFNCKASKYEVNNFYALQSYNYPECFVRHSNFVAKITKIAADTTLDINDSTFKIVPGLADSNGVSFESKNYP